MGSNTQDKSIGSDVGSVAGGIIGSLFFPGVGTAIGSAAGGQLGGAIGSEFGPQSSGGSGTSGSGGMGSLVNAVTGLFGAGQNIKNQATANQLGTQYNAIGQQQGALAPYDFQLANTDVGYANTLAGYGDQTLAGGESQYQAGLTGQLTPAQRALTDYTLGQSNVGTENVYGSLGLGGSTMESQGLNANALQSLAQQEAINFQNEQYGLWGLGTGQGELQGAGALNAQAQNAVAGGAGLLGEQGQNILNQIQTLLNAGGAGANATGNLLGGATAGGNIGAAATGAGNSLQALASALGLGGGSGGGAASALGAGVDTTAAF